jgi:predicted alpha/beta-fold hydrolase
MSLLADPPRKAAFPPFDPHPLLRNGHLQTIVARYMPGPAIRLPSTYHEVDLGGGEALSVFQSVPDTWLTGDPAVVLVHGLAGCVRSPYLSRVALKLYRRGLRVVRMNLRGAGSGYGRSRSYYHGGRSEDPRAVLGWLARRAPGSPIALVGFSLGANLTLKVAGEAADDPIEGLDCVISANPPIDLYASCLHLRGPQGRVYDRNFIRLLRDEERKLRFAFPELEPLDFSRVSNLFEFDDAYTAPRNGFRDAADYYEQSSSIQLIPNIKLPGLVIHAADDPFIPVEPFLTTEFPPQLALELNPYGGHLGYLDRKTLDGDRRWLDARIISWLLRRWEIERDVEDPVLDEESSPRHDHGGRYSDGRHPFQ